MRVSIGITPVFYAALATASVMKRDCSHNNCLRGNPLLRILFQAGQPVPIAALSWSPLSHLQPGNTVTVNVISTVATIHNGNNPARRDLEARATPSIPSYAAGPCSSSASKYSSACSCIGVTASTVTAATPVTTLTVVTATTTRPSFAVATYGAKQCVGIASSSQIAGNGECVSVTGTGSYFVSPPTPFGCSGCQIFRYESRDCSGDSFAQGYYNECTDISGGESFLIQCPADACDGIDDN
ncbi:hypothetical protein TWF694_009254 [Orbilia ellipsospora]|uniref:Uncharacterized protein n=1 Tax=Orbilia ellipsospora TaxID=2528407 RepID=A0AAV9XEC9_9PEZI